MGQSLCLRLQACLGKNNSESWLYYSNGNVFFVFNAFIASVVSSFVMFSFQVLSEVQPKNRVSQTVRQCKCRVYDVATVFYLFCTRVCDHVLFALMVIHTAVHQCHVDNVDDIKVMLLDQGILITVSYS